MAYEKTRHDWGILRTNGTKTGLMLRRKDGVPIWKVYDDEYILNQQTTSAGYDSLPPEKEFTLILDDWRSGFGLETYDSNDPYRYYESYNMDLRSKNRVIASYKATAITLDSYPGYIQNAGFETFAAGSFTNWTLTTDQGTPTIAQDTVNIDSGSSAAKLGVDANGDKGHLQQSITWHNNYRSKAISIKYSGYKSGADVTFWMVIYDGVDTTTQAGQADAAYAQKTVTHTINAAATELTIKLYAWCNGVGTGYALFDSIMSDIPYKGVPTAMIDFNDIHYLATGNILWKTTDLSTFTIVDVLETGKGQDPANLITDLEVFSDNKLYIACGWSHAYYEMTTAEAFTVNTLSNNTMKFLKFYHGTSDTMLGVDTNSTIRTTTNPADGGTAWSAQTQVDADSIDITDTLEAENTPYVLKEDRPFYIDSAGDVKKLTESTKHLQTSTGGKNTIEWLDGIYMPYGKALLEYDKVSGSFTWLNPSDFCTNLSAFSGTILALAGDEKYLYCAVDNSPKVEILAGRYETINGTTSWVWHTEFEITLAGVEAMYITSVSQKTLMIGSTSVSDSLYKIPLPSSYGDVANDANRSFATDGSQYFVTPRLHANFKGDTKAFIKVVAELGHSYSASVYFECHYKKQGDSSWTDAGDLVGTSSSREATLYLPVDASLNKPSSKWMQFKIVAVTNSATVTPILNRFEVRGVLYPAVRDIIYCEVLAAKKVTLDNTTERDNDATVIGATIDEARSATYPVTIYDIDGATQTVKFLSVSPDPKMQIAKQEKGEKLEKLYKILMQKVTTSA